MGFHSILGFGRTAIFDPPVDPQDSYRAGIEGKGTEVSKKPVQNYRDGKQFGDFPAKITDRS
jgi:hypothetical protein